MLIFEEEKTMRLKKLTTVCCTLAMAASIILPAGSAVAAEEVPEATEGAIVVDAAVPIEVTGGKITGTTSEDGEIAIYKGIPYAQAPVGDLRWAAPMDPEPWEGVKACEKFGPVSWQNWPNFDMPWMYVYSPEFLCSEERDIRDEDCLYLNVWTKQGGTDGKRPVIVYIHGGGFGEGSGSIPVYDGTNLAKDDIVFVNINYRLGVQGFLTIKELDEESPYGTSGNYGIIDCVKSLEWVKANIAKFGGDPDNVTIAGQSAGGMAVNVLIHTHIATGLFNNAVVFSGGYMNLNRGGLGGETKEEAQAAFRETYPDVTLEELRTLSMEELFNNYPIGNSTVIDHAIIGEGNVESRLAGDFNPVNVMVGYVNGDAGLFSGGSAATTVDEYYTWLDENYGEDAELMKELYPVASDEEVAAVCSQISYDRMVMGAWGEALMETFATDNDAFIYFVDHEVPADVPVGMFHTGDIPYWLGGTLVDRAQYETDDDHAMYQTMKSYFENFIAKADPNGEGLPQWDKFDGSYRYMLIGDNTYEMTEIPKERGDYWVSVLNTLYEGAVDTALQAMDAE